MSDLVAKARAALDGVTPGEWFVSAAGNCGDATLEVGSLDVRVAYHELGFDDPIDDNIRANFQFIAEARSLVPDMADRIDALEAENARLREALGRIVSTSQAMSADYICNGGESGHERTARIAFAALTAKASHA